MAQWPRPKGSRGRWPCPPVSVLFPDFSPAALAARCLARFADPRPGCRARAYLVASQLHLPRPSCPPIRWSGPDHRGLAPACRRVRSRGATRNDARPMSRSAACSRPAVAHGCLRSRTARFRSLLDVSNESGDLGRRDLINREEELAPGTYLFVWQTVIRVDPTIG